MRKYKNKLFAILLSIFAAISFTSCDDYEWRQGTMDYYSTINAAANGVISANLPIDFNNVLVDGRYNDIDDIRYRGGKIEINTNDRIGIITLSVSNSNISVDLDVPRGGGTYIGSRVDDFLNAVVEVVRRNGYATIYVDGRYADRYARFDLDFYIDIDAYVRE
ncbi:hypothetical protein [Dysgonomonas sp.]|jgi:hypothetical protein|nr:hypothetical protein [Prevotella sp.]